MSGGGRAGAVTNRIVICRLRKTPDIRVRTLSMQMWLGSAMTCCTHAVFGYCPRHKLPGLDAVYHVCLQPCILAWSRHSRLTKTIAWSQATSPAKIPSQLMNIKLPGTYFKANNVSVIYPKQAKYDDLTGNNQTAIFPRQQSQGSIQSSPLTPRAVKASRAAPCPRWVQGQVLPT